MTVKVGSLDVADVRVGAAQAVALYAGAVKVWPSAPAGPTLWGRWTWNRATSNIPAGQVRWNATQVRLLVALADADGVEHPETTAPPLGSAVTIGGLVTFRLDAYEYHAPTSVHRLTSSELSFAALDAALVTGTTYEITWE